MTKKKKRNIIFAGLHFCSPWVLESGTGSAQQRNENNELPAMKNRWNFRFGVHRVHLHLHLIKYSLFSTTTPKSTHIVTSECIASNSIQCESACVLPFCISLSHLWYMTYWRESEGESRKCVLVTAVTVEKQSKIF